MRPSPSPAWSALVAGALGALSPLAACDGGATCFDYGSFDGAAPAVSFQADVLPILRQACGLSSSCHGSQSSNRNYLGPALQDPAPTPADIAAIFADNVGVPSDAEPTMAIVEPGDPANSFLLHKIDGTFECAALTCGASCGDTMPQGADLLPQADRDVIRRWVAQGAKND